MCLGGNACGATVISARQLILLQGRLTLLLFEALGRGVLGQGCNLLFFIERYYTKAKAFDMFRECR